MIYSVCKKWRPALPLPPTPVVIGSRVRAFVSYASIILRLSYEQIQHILSDLYAFTLSQGEITNILDQEARKLIPVEKQLHIIIRAQPGVHYDETGLKVQREDKGNHAWVMTGTETPDAVFLMGRSRGKGNAEELMGEKTPRTSGLAMTMGRIGIFLKNINSAGRIHCGNYVILPNLIRWITRYANNAKRCMRNSLYCMQTFASYSPLNLIFESESTHKIH